MFLFFRLIVSFLVACGCAEIQFQQESSKPKHSKKKDLESKAVTKEPGQGNSSREETNELEKTHLGGNHVELIGTTTAYACEDKLVLSVPDKVQKGDLLALFLHRTDAPLYPDQKAIAAGGLPLTNGLVDQSWKKQVSCYMRVNGRPCTEDWNHQDLIQTFLWKVYNGEKNAYSVQLPRDKHGPGWAVLTVLRNADPNSPILASATRSPDGDRRTVFPQVEVMRGGYLLLSQSFDDAVAKNLFQPPTETIDIAYVTGGRDQYGCANDETGFLFGKKIESTGKGKEYTSNGNGASTHKDIMISVSIKPKN